MGGLDRMDKDVRALLRTRCWEGILLSLGLAALLVNSLVTGSIRFGNSRFVLDGAVTMHGSEQPVDFFIVMAIIATILAGSLWYTWIRWSWRRRVLKEEAADKSRRVRND